MTAGVKNRPMEQGSTFTLQITLKNSTTGLPIDLTGAVVRSMIRESVDDPSPIISFTIDIDGDPTTGIFTLRLTATQTAALEFTKALYDVEVEYPDGRVERVLQGNIVLSKEVTK